jgi:hypothetical protein
MRNAASYRCTKSPRTLRLRTQCIHRSISSQLLSIVILLVVFNNTTNYIQLLLARKPSLEQKVDMLSLYHTDMQRRVDEADKR